MARPAASASARPAPITWPKRWTRSRRCSAWRLETGLIFAGVAPTERLHGGAPCLALETLRLFGLARLGLPPRRRRGFRGFAEQGDETVQRVLSIAVLRPETLRQDHQDALPGQTPACQLLGAHGDIVGQRGRAANVEAQLYGRGQLVDVLAARARGAHERLLDLSLVDADGRSDLDHAAERRPGRPAPPDGDGISLSQSGP